MLHINAGVGNTNEPKAEHVRTYVQMSYSSAVGSAGLDTPGQFTAKRDRTMHPMYTHTRMSTKRTTDGHYLYGTITAS